MTDPCLTGPLLYPASYTIRPRPGSSWRSRPEGPETCWTRRAPAQSSQRSGLLWLVPGSNHGLARCVYLFGSGHVPDVLLLALGSGDGPEPTRPAPRKSFPGDCRRCTPGL